MQFGLLEKSSILMPDLMSVHLEAETAGDFNRFWYKTFRLDRI